MINPIVAQILKEKISSISAYRLPVFIRTLVHSTTSHCKKCDFPGDRHFQKPGWDGIVVSDESNAWVPEGKSFWELTTTQEKNINYKADSDFNKRLEGLKEELNDEFGKGIALTYIFVVNKSFNNKDKWLKEKQKKSPVQIRVYDIDNLQDWVENSPQALFWLAQEFGIPIDGISSLKEKSEQWSTGNSILSNINLFKNDIDSYNEVIKQYLLKEDNEVLTIKCNEILEGFAFLYHFFNNKELCLFFDKTIIFDKSAILNYILESNKSLISIVTNIEDLEKISRLSCKCIYITTSPKSNSDIVLRGFYQENLDNEELSYLEKIHLYRFSEGSRCALRRMLLQYKEFTLPRWSRNSEITTELILPAFIHSFSLSDYSEIWTLFEEISIDKKYIKDVVNKIRNLDESPILYINGHFKIISMYDTLRCLSYEITSTHIEELIKLGEEVLKVETNENSESSEKIKFKYSTDIQRNIFTTILLIKSRGELTQNDCNKIDPIKGFIRKVWKDIKVDNFERYESIFQLLCESHPDLFLLWLKNVLENGLYNGIKLKKILPQIYTCLEVVSYIPEFFSSSLSQVLMFAEKFPNAIISDQSPEAILARMLCRQDKEISVKEKLYKRLKRYYPEVLERINTRRFKRLFFLPEYALPDKVIRKVELGIDFYDIRRFEDNLQSENRELSFREIKDFSITDLLIGAQKEIVDLYGYQDENSCNFQYLSELIMIIPDLFVELIQNYYSRSDKVKILYLPPIERGFIRNILEALKVDRKRVDVLKSWVEYIRGMDLDKSLKSKIDFYIGYFMANELYGRGYKDNDAIIDVIEDNHSYSMANGIITKLYNQTFNKGDLKNKLNEYPEDLYYSHGFFYIYVIKKLLEEIKKEENEMAALNARINF